MTIQVQYYKIRNRVQYIDVASPGLLMTGFKEISAILSRIWMLSVSGRRRPYLMANSLLTLAQLVKNGARCASAVPGMFTISRLKIKLFLGLKDLVALDYGESENWPLCVFWR